MFYYLNKARKMSGIRQMNSKLTRLIRLTIETGLLCAILAIVVLILFFVYANNDAHIAPTLAMSKLYSNSLLAVSHGSA